MLQHKHSHGTFIKVLKHLKMLKVETLLVLLWNKYNFIDLNVVCLISQICA